MSIDLPSRIASLTHFGSSGILWLLIVLSVVAVAIIVERALALLSDRADADLCRRDISDHLRKGALAAARERAEQLRPLFAELTGMSAPKGRRGAEQTERCRSNRTTACGF